MTLLISLAIAGITLLILELFLPGAIAGIAGLICLAAATTITFNKFGFQTGLTILAAEILLGITALILWIRYIPNSFIGRLFSLKKEAPPQSTATRDYERLLGATGKTLSPLRPSGVANFNGQRLDVVSEGNHIEPGKDIKVVKVEGARIVVRLIS